MSNDDQLMMNQAHILIPDEGHEEEIDPADLFPPQVGILQSLLSLPQELKKDGKRWKICITS